MFKRIKKNFKNESKKLFNKISFLKKNQKHLIKDNWQISQSSNTENKDIINFKDIKLDYAWYQEFLVYLVHLLRPEVYCELGIAEGCVFNRIAPLVKISYGVDLRGVCKENISDSPNSIFFCGTTTDFAKSLKAKGKKIDFLFIDADHSKKAVADDFYNFFDLINPHGFIVFHDTHPADQEMTSSGRCGDCYDIIMKLQKDNLVDCEMMTIPIHPGLTLCRKRKKQLKWHEIPN